MGPYRKTAVIGALSALFLASPLVAFADGGLAPVTDPLTRKECGECHMAFSPRLLPAQSWEIVMANLDNHYGDNARLPEQETQAITAYLTANAGRWRSPGMPARDGTGAVVLPRFMDVGWFAHEHRRLSPDRMARRGIKSITDCVACHRGAEQGYFDDD